MSRTRTAMLVPALVVLAAIASAGSSQDARTPADRPAGHRSPDGDPMLVIDIRRRLGEIIGTEVRRARASGDQTHSVVYLRSMRELWEDDRLRDAPAIIEAGRKIIDIHTSRDDHQRRLDASVEVLAVIDAHRDRWLAMTGDQSMHQRMAGKIDGHVTSILSGMQSGSQHGRPHIELAALERIIALETNDHNRANFIDQRDSLRKRMAAGLYGPDEPPPPAR